MDGACARCVIDNSSVIIATGTGADARIAPEMAAFARTLGFEFRAHRVGHADRKGRIERPFAFVEGNFLAARSFTDFADLNRQALAWCREVANAKPKRALGMSAEAAYLIEKPHLLPLPALLPPVYEVFERIVDLHGFVSVDSVRYSVPERLVSEVIGPSPQIARKSLGKLHCESTIYRERLERAKRSRSTSTPMKSASPSVVARSPCILGSSGSVMHAASFPDTTQFRSALRAHQHSKSGSYPVIPRPSSVMARASSSAPMAVVRAPCAACSSSSAAIPAAAFRAALEQALQFGLFDLGRLETLILKYVAGEFFALELPSDSDA